MNNKQKENIRHLLKFSPIYHTTLKKLFAPFYEQTLYNTVIKAIQNVPFYKEYTKYIRQPFSIKELPIIRKKDIMGREREMVSKHVCSLFLSRKETGGSTGFSLELFYSPSVIIKKDVIPNYAFSVIGEKLHIATLRGQRPQNGATYQNIGRGNIILSSYLLSEKTIDEYLSLLKKYRINCLHVYPSSLSIMTRLIKSKYGKANLPDLKGILASSEIFSREEKKLVQEVFPGIKLVDLYGHNELACCAVAIDNGYFKFFPNYGYVEFIDTNERVNGHIIAEIVATSIMNTTMPFIRYGTEDYVELDEEGNVVSIIGRTSDFVINCEGKLTPCILSTRSRSMQNVTNFQYYQPQKGVLIYRVVVNDKFNDIDKKFILEDMNQSFNGLMKCEVAIVTCIERNQNGKQKRLVQDVDLKDYK